MLYIPHPFKYCSYCNSYKPQNQFPRNRSKKDGLSTECHECNRQRTRKWADNHPDQVLDGKKRWVKNNPVKRKLISSRSTDKHRIARNNRRRNSYAQNPIPRRIQGNIRYSKKRELLSTLTVTQWQGALDWWYGVCAYCGNPPRLWDDPRVLQQDHFIPISANGEYTALNILPACLSCNTSKRNKRPQEWLIEHFGPRKAKAIMKHIQDYFDWVKVQE